MTFLVSKYFAVFRFSIELQVDNLNGKYKISKYCQFEVRVKHNAIISQFGKW